MTSLTQTNLMDKKSTFKIYNAGFVFYRAFFDVLKKEGQITYSENPGSWKVHSKGYKTKAKTLEALEKIRDEDPKALID